MAKDDKSDMNQKTVFIPGWMHSPKYFKLGKGLDVWREDVDIKQPFDGDYLVGHSMGAAIALQTFSLDKNKKLILVNPFIRQKNVWQTFFKWLRFACNERFIRHNLIGLRYLPRNLKILFRFPEKNYWEILKKAPRDRVKILHGEKDLFLCDKNVCAEFQKMGFEVIEVPEAGHNWHPNFDAIITKIIHG